MLAAIPSVSEFPRSPGYDQLMAVPYGFKSWQEYVDKHIAECGDCAPYFQGDGQMSIEGKETEVSWLALELGLPDRVSKRLIKNARCDGCGNSISEMWEVFVRPTREVEFRAAVDRAIAKHRPRIDEFREFLTKHPYLGASDKTGRLLMQTVAKVEPVTIGGSWFRCIRERDGKPPTPDDFRAPVEDQAWPISEGRFNHSGQAHWYLADHERTAIAEVLDLGAGVVWTQEFKIDPCVKVLDVSTSIEGDSSPPEIKKIEVALALVMMGALDGYVDRNRAWKPGYLVPRFVMDAAKLAGFEGIVYRSARAFEGLNLVLFRRDWRAECVGESKRHEEKEAPEIHAPAVKLPDLDF